MSFDTAYIVFLRQNGVDIDSTLALKILKLSFQFLGEIIPVPSAETTVPAASAATAVALAIEYPSELPFKVRLPFEFKITDVDVRRKFIRDNSGLSAYPTSAEILAALPTIANLYDTYFFGGVLAYQLRRLNGSLRFEISDRMTSTAGSCKAEGYGGGGLTTSEPGQCTYTIKLGGQVMEQVTPATVATGRIVQGGTFVVRDRLDAVLLTLEHELVHLLIQTSPFKPMEDAHGSLFKSMILNLFGHTKSTHNLIIPTIASTTEGKTEINTTERRPGVITIATAYVGQKVKFISKKGETIHGTISKVNRKRVKVQDNAGVKWNAEPSFLTPE